MERRSEILADGLKFPECPRWHDGALWFSDVHAHRIMRLHPDGTLESMVEDAHQPSGLGWTPDGDLVYVRMVERCIVRRDGAGNETVHVDMTALESVQTNDMTVDTRGNAYVGGFGFDINAGQPPKPAHVILARADGSMTAAASEMMFPNGMVITPDGRTLVVAETAARRLTTFDIADDGSLSNRRVWATLSIFPDGICLDAEGAIWVASPVSGECIRVREGGDVTDAVKSHAKGVYACMLGGDDRRTLYLCTANTTGPELVQGISTGWIEAADADVPGAGLP
jgi:sugar lactone lactonase YvrE